MWKILKIRLLCELKLIHQNKSGVMIRMWINLCVAISLINWQLVNLNLFTLPRYMHVILAGSNICTTVTVDPVSPDNLQLVTDPVSLQLVTYPVSLQLVTDPVSLQLVTDPVSPSSSLSSSDLIGLDLIYYFFDNCICISIMWYIIITKCCWDNRTFIQYMMHWSNVECHRICILIVM